MTRVAEHNGWQRAHLNLGLLISNLGDFMARCSQTIRSLRVITPLCENVLLVTGFRDTQQISHLLSFQLTLIGGDSSMVDFNGYSQRGFSANLQRPGGYDLMRAHAPFLDRKSERQRTARIRHSGRGGL